MAMAVEVGQLGFEVDPTWIWMSVATSATCFFARERADLDPT